MQYLMDYYSLNTPRLMMCISFFSIIFRQLIKGPTMHYRFINMLHCHSTQCLPTYGNSNIVCDAENIKNNN